MANNGGQIAAGGVTSDREAIWINTQFNGVSSNPLGRHKRVFNGRREFVLGGKAVIDCHDTTAAFVRECAAKPVIRIEVAENPGAAMKINYAPGQRIADAPGA